MSWKDKYIAEIEYLSEIIISGAVFVKTGEPLRRQLRSDKREYKMFTIGSSTYVAVPDTKNDRDRFRFLYSTVVKCRFEQEKVLNLIAQELRHIRKRLED